MIRKLLYNDRSQLVKIVEETENFSPEEKQVAIELINEAINNPNHEYYNTFIYEEEGKIYGYHCTGKRALTDGVYDLYWIVVDKKTQNKGLGKKLLDHAESFVKENNGRWILAETSSKDNYNATRNFYLRNKYSIVAEIRDFYKVSDNLIVFGKYIK